jgi:hypothetical protein
MGPGGPWGPAGTYPTSRPKVRPGRVWYLIPLLMVIGGVAWLVLGVASFTHQIDDMARVTVPPGGTVSLSHSGDYTVYYEAKGASSRALPSFEVVIRPTSPSQGKPSLTSYGHDLTYDFGSHEGRAVLNLHVASAGQYQVAAPSAPRVAGGSDLAFGPDLTAGVVGAIVGGILLLGAGIVVWLILLIVRIVRKSSMRKAASTIGAWQ